MATSIILATDLRKTYGMGDIQVHALAGVDCASQRANSWP